MSRPLKDPIEPAQKEGEKNEVVLPNGWTYGIDKNNLVITKSSKKHGRPYKVKTENSNQEKSTTILENLPKIPSSYIESIPQKTINIHELIGKNYDDFWNCKKRYRVLMGSRSSKKSVTTAFNYIIRMMAMPDANLLCLRRFKDTHKRSCFANIQWCIYKLGVTHLWNFTQSPLEATYIPTGQKIYFAGLDEPLKLTSITTPRGVLCWVWIEELFEIKNPDVFDMINQGIRGRVPDGYFKQITMTFNPWAPFWAKYRFFDVCNPTHPTYDAEEAKRIWCGITNWKMNEFLDNEDRINFLSLKRLDPAKYEVAGLGNWGSPTDIIYPNYTIEPINTRDIHMKYNENIERGIGLDFGFVNYGVAIEVLYNHPSKDVWVISEHIHQGATNQDIAVQLKTAGFEDWLIVADSSEPKSMLELKKAGFWNLHGSRSGPDTVLYGIQLLRGLKIHIDRSCTHLIDEIAIYTWEIDNETGEKIDRPACDQKDHCLDALRYIISYMYRNSNRQ